MKFEVPIDLPPLTEVEQTVVHDSVEFYDGFIYFHRLSKPTVSLVIYSSTYILQLLKETQISRLIIDFTDRELINHRLRRLMLHNASDIVSSISDVVIVVGDNSFRRVIIAFFVRAYIRKSDVKVTYCSNKESAIAYMRGIISS